MVDKKRNWSEVEVDTGTVWDKEKPIEGGYGGVEENVGPNESRMYTIKTNDGEIKVWGSKVLDDKLLGIPKGSYVKIEYGGKVKSKKGTEYHDYKVFVDLETTPVIEDGSEDEEVISRDELNDLFPDN